MEEIRSRRSSLVVQLPFLALALGPALAFSTGKVPATETDSRVTDAGEAAASVEMTAATTTGGGTTQGTIRVTQLAEGVLLEPALEGLPPGLHGFHVHENGNCDPAREQDQDTANPSVKPAGEAGEHWDPGAKGNHEGPWGHGHLGDLPNLYVDRNGVASLPVYAPRISLSDLEKRALVVHENRDNYTDEPDGKGGSGSAIACGVLTR